MTRDRAQVNDGVLTIRDGELNRDVPVGSEAWYRWLNDPATISFAFQDGATGFTARRELRHGHGYWYAYRRQQGTLRKRYLGRADDLTLGRLQAVAAEFVTEPPPGMAPSRRASALPGPAVPVPRHNLPAAVSSFLGRASAIAAVNDLVASHRLVTLAGPGGIGKTRLACQAATVLVGGAFDAVWLVELDALFDPALVPDTVAQAIGVREEPGQPRLATLTAALGGSRVLMILDNCEHLLDPCADLADRLLRSCPDLRILATSREPLGSPAETVWRVPGLPLPAAEQPAAPPDIETSEAVALFVARAQAARPGFSLLPDHCVAVAAICRQLDGIPLAIELAAAQIAAWSPEDIASRLHADGHLPTVRRGTTPRHRTLRAAIDWSYDLLSLHEQRCFARLAVFAGGFSFDAAEAVCADDEIAPDAVRELLTRLVDRSLVLGAPEAGDRTTRFRLLETLRGYGRDRLANAGELEQTRERHVAWLLARSEEAAGAFYGPDQGFWLQWAGQEFDNARVALAWTLERGRAASTVQLAVAFSWPWSIYGRWSEGLEWAQRALAIAPAEPTQARGMLLVGAAQLAAFRGDLTSNRPSGDLAAVSQWVAESYAIGQTLADDYLILAASGLAQMLEEFGLPVAAVPWMSGEQGLADARRTGQTWGERRALEALARDALRNQDYPSARRWMLEAIASARRDGDTWSLAMALNELGDVERAMGAHAVAAPMYEESARLFTALGLGAQPNLLHNLGYTALAAGEMARAAMHFREALTLFRRSGERRGMAECLIGLGALAAAERRPIDAARLFGVAEAAFEALAIQLWPANRTDFERWLARAKMTRSTAAFDRAWAEGHAMSLQTATAWALGGELPAPPHEPPCRASLPLTPREEAVARLAAQGRTNREIGETLAIAEKTVANHLLRALEKLDLRTRTQLAARAGELGLDRP